MKENDIVTFKMTSGDEVVAKFISRETNHSYEVSKPHGVVMAQQGFGLVPWILTVDPDKKIFINWSSVTSVNMTHKRVAQEYIKQTTGLVV